MLKRLREIANTRVDEHSVEHLNLHRELWGIISKGDKDAVLFLSMLGDIFRVWDDLIDRDKPVTDGGINRAFWLALIELPKNQFYRRHLDHLIPVLTSHINYWFDANTFEALGEHERTLSFVFRNVYNDILNQVAYLKGGYDWLRAVSPFIRKFTFSESLEEYLPTIRRKTWDA